MKSKLLLLIALLLPALAVASGLTNEDVIKMAAAKLDDSIIITAIENSDPKFDTSSQGIIELSTAKVPQPIIAAIIKRNNTTTTAPASAPKPAAVPAAVESELMSPSEVIMIDGAQIKPMRYLTPQVRSAARGLGFGGVASYAVLHGSQANARISNKQPSFLISVPNQAQVESYVTIASFAVRKNNSREVMIGGGYMSYSSGIHPDRIIAVDSVKAEDQSKATKGFIIYKIVPKHAMAAGEYAVILYTGEMQGLVSAWFAGGGGNSYFDFGVDP